MSITNRVKKNVQNQPPEFKTGSIIKTLDTSKKVFLNDPSNESVFRAVFNFMGTCGVFFHGVLMSSETEQMLVYIPSQDFNKSAELIAVQIKATAEFENVSIDKVLGKVMASIYESEKEES